MSDYIDGFEQIEDRIFVKKASEDPLSADVYLVRGDSFNWIFDTGDSREALELLKAIPNKRIIISHFHRDHLGNVERLSTDDYVGIDRKLDDDLVAEGAPDRSELENDLINRHNRGDRETWDPLVPHDSANGAYAGAEPDLNSLPFIGTDAMYVSPYSLKYTRYGTVVNSELNFKDGINLKILPIPSSHAKGCLALEIDGRIVLMGDSTYPLPKKGGDNVYNVQLLKQTIDFIQCLGKVRLALSHDKRFDRPAAVILRQLEMAYSERKPGEPYIHVS